MAVLGLEAAICGAVLLVLSGLTADLELPTNALDDRFRANLDLLLDGQVLGDVECASVHLPIPG